MKRKMCMLLLLAVVVNQSLGYGIKTIPGGSYSGSYSSASASSSASSFSSSFSSDGHLPKYNALPTAGAYASANAHAGAHAGAQAWSGASSGAGANSISGAASGNGANGVPGSANSGAWSGSAAGAGADGIPGPASGNGANSIPGSTAGSNDANGSGTYTGYNGHTNSVPDNNKPLPVKYTSGTYSHGTVFGGNTGSATGTINYSHGTGGKEGCCKGPFPGPNGSIHDYKPAPPGGGGPDPAWLQGGNAGPAHVQKTPTYNKVPTTVTHGTSGLTDQLIHSFPGKPGSIFDHKPATAGDASATGVSHQGSSKGPEYGCGPFNPGCNKYPINSQTTQHHSSGTGIAGTTSLAGDHGSSSYSKPGSSVDIIGKLPGHTGSIYDSKPPVAPTHPQTSTSSFATGSTVSNTLSHSAPSTVGITVTPGSAASQVIGKLPGPSAHIDYSKPAVSTTSAGTYSVQTGTTEDFRPKVPLIHVVLPAGGGTGTPSGYDCTGVKGCKQQTGTTPSVSYSQGQAGATSAASATTASGQGTPEITRPVLAPSDRTQPTKPIYEPSSESGYSTGSSSGNTLNTQSSGSTSTFIDVSTAQPTYTSKPDTPSPYYQSNNAPQVPINGICPFGSPNCKTASTVAGSTSAANADANANAGTSVTHPGTGQLPIEGSTAETYDKTPSGYGFTSKPAGTPCSGPACSPVSYPVGCSGGKCGGGSTGSYNINSAASGSDSSSQNGFATGSVDIQKSPGCVGTECQKPVFGCSGPTCNNAPASYSPSSGSGSQSGDLTGTVPTQKSPGCIGIGCSKPSECSGASCNIDSNGGFPGNYPTSPIGASGAQTGFATGSIDIQKSPGCIGNDCAKPVGDCSGGTCNGGAGYPGSYPAFPNGGSVSPSGYASGSVDIHQSPGCIGAACGGPLGGGCIGSACNKAPGADLGNNYPVNSGYGGSGDGFATGSVLIQKGDGQITTGSDQSGSYYPDQSGTGCSGNSCKIENLENKPDQADCSSGACSNHGKDSGNKGISGSYSNTGSYNGGTGVSNSGAFSGTYSGSVSVDDKFKKGGCSNGACSGDVSGYGNSQTSGSYSHSGSNHGSGCRNRNCGNAHGGSGSVAYSGSYSSSGFGSGSGSGSNSGCGSGNCGGNSGGSFGTSSSHTSGGTDGGFYFPDFSKHFGGSFSKAFSGSISGSKSSASSYAVASSGSAY